ncbi:MAG: hypothetical protein MUF62_08770, partial [Chitinophagaceae bacterium]|nr:hypothetical protein [Chitinophagaceae bacterium]
MTDRKALFFELLVYKLSGEGFRYVKSKKRLVKVTDGNEFIIGYNIWPYFSQVEADYCMLLKEVEDVKKSA